MFHPLNSIRSCLLLLSAAILLLTATNRVSAARATSAEDSDPSNIHAIIVSSSRYWFNYRHAINALGISVRSSDSIAGDFSRLHR